MIVVIAPHFLKKHLHNWTHNCQLGTKKCKQTHEWVMVRLNVTKMIMVL
jgi:hypothetical protein